MDHRADQAAAGTSSRDAGRTCAILTVCVELAILSGLVVLEAAAGPALRESWMADALWRYALLLAAAGAGAYAAAMVVVWNGRPCGRVRSPGTGQPARWTFHWRRFARRLGQAGRTPVILLLPHAWVGGVYWPVISLLIWAGWCLAGFVRLSFGRTPPGEPMEPSDSPKPAEELRALAAACGLGRVQVVWVPTDGPGGPQAAAAAVHGRPAVFLDRTLPDRLSPRELRAVFAHELAHHALRHAEKTFLASAAADAAALMLAGAALAVAGPAGGSWWLAARAAPSVLLAWYLAGLTLSPLGKAYLRRQELQADRRAIQITDDPEAFASAYRKLAPPGAEAAGGRLARWLLDDAPCLRQRLAVAKHYAARGNRVQLLSRRNGEDVDR